MTPTDPKALRALAHPVRWRLLDLLTSEQTATATRCAEVLGESVANCSYHLNTLARYGYIEEAPGGQGREKPWRLASTAQNLAAPDDSPAGRLASQAAVDVFLDHELGRLKDWQRRAGAESPRWRGATGMTGTTVFVTAAELTELTAELTAVATRFAERMERRETVPAGAREARVFVATALAAGGEA